MSVMALARGHIEGKHADDPTKGCALCPACVWCGGKGQVIDATGLAPKFAPCKPCHGTGSQKGGGRK